MPSIHGPNSTGTPYPGAPLSVPGPAPGAPTTPPLGTVRPPLSTLQEMQEVKAELATSQEGAPPPEVARGMQLKKLTRIEWTAYQQSLLITQLRSENNQLRRELRANTRESAKGATMSQIAAYAAAAGPVFLAFSTALGQWGAAHPEAPLTFTGVVLALVKAVSLWRAPARAQQDRADDAAGMATASATPSWPPPDLEGWSPPSPPHGGT